MDKTALVDTSIENGRRLIESLDKAEFPVDAALWLYSPDSDDWRLTIASNLVDRLGPLQTYGRVQTVLTSLPPESRLALKDISVVSPKSPLIQAFRRAARAAPDGHEFRLRQSAINGMFVEDAYVYRVS
jgi:hypothetical protein